MADQQHKETLFNTMTNYLDRAKRSRTIEMALIRRNLREKSFGTARAGKKKLNSDKGVAS